MNIVFFGTPQFAAKVLSYLIHNNVKIVAVVSKPDKPKGRSSKLVPTPIKEVALKEKIPIHQPEKASTDEFATILKSYRPDLFVVVAYGEIIRQHILDIPTKACINLHASLLPKLRGAAPIQRAIINGMDKTGISIMHMVKKMDAGDVIAQVECPILPNETRGELEEKLCDIGSKELLKVLHEFERDECQRSPQDETLVTMAPKIELEDCHIRWDRPSQDIHNLIRGVNPAPGAWSEVMIKDQKTRMKIFKSEISQFASETVGKAFSIDNELYISCDDRCLKIIELQPAGKRKMLASSWLLGVDLNKVSFLVT